MPTHTPYASAGFALSLLAIAGCSSPYTPLGQDDLRLALLDSVTREIRDANRWAEPITTTRQPGVERLKIDTRFLPELERMAGPHAYENADPDLGVDLYGRDPRLAVVNLERVVLTAVANNLDASFARFAPGIARAQVAEAEAAFDWTFFTNFSYQNIDEPRTRQAVGSSVFGVGVDQREVTELTSGLRRSLESGGQVTLQHEIAQSESFTPGLSNSPNPAQSTGLVLQLDQPLLRGFGSDIALAQVRLARNAERDRIAQLERELQRVVAESERAYWQLVQAHRDVLIFDRSLQRALETLRKVEARDWDASPDQLSDARAQVERRRQQLLLSQLTLRNASDDLKRLMNDPDLTIGSDVLLIPADSMLDEPLTIGLRDAIMNAIANRPEVKQALLSIDDTSIRLQVANNARLPRLDLRLQTRLSGLDDDYRSAYAAVADTDFVNYLLGLEFEVPIGNRAAESLMTRRRLEQMQAVEAYKQTVQGVLLDVVGALRTVRISYQLIEQARVSRLAESENLRVFQVQNELTRERSVTRLAEEFRRQEALATAEQAEFDALSSYNSAIATLYQAMGVGLARNGIDLVIPDQPGP